MDSHASKRRKTSPRTSIPIPSAGDNHATDGTAPPPPPSNGNDAPGSQSPRKKRPSFASPTKASLSRHNPEILARRRQSAREALQAQQQQQKQKPQHGNTATTRQAETTRPPDQPASTPGSPDSDISLSELLTAQLEEQVTAGKAAVSARPRRSPTKPVLFTRPLPPPPPEGEEELVDPFKRRPRIRRSNVAEEPAEEPELPPTPSQLGIEDPVVTTPPRGIHSSSSPTKRRLANRDRRVRTIPMRKSPLKKQFVPSAVQEREEAEEEESEAIDALANPQRAEKGKEVEVEPHPARAVLSDEEIRGMEEYLEALRTEEEDLWSDLKMISGLGREWAMQAQAAKLIPFIKKHPKLIRLPDLPDAGPSVQDEIDAMLRGAMDPSALLPFSKPTTELTTTTTSNTEKKPLPTSHLPVSMTAQEELPYLQIFSPLAFTSHNTPLTSADMESNIQRHDISIRALDAPHLFSARLTMIVDLSDFSITDLKVPRLDPNAQRELGPFIEDLLTRTDRAMARNVSLVTWAMGEWYRLAVKRARFWRSLAREFEDAKRLGAHAERLWKNRARQYNREVGGTIDDEMAKEDEGLSTGDVGGDMGRAAMTVGLGRWGEEELMVRVGWKIRFDWTGDARSKVSVAVGMPGRWHRGDRNGVLAKVPQIFDDYVRGTSDVMAAVRRVVALVGYDADAPEARNAVAA